eukprot:EG_transcript_39348
MAHLEVRLESNAYRPWWHFHTFVDPSLEAAFQEKNQRATVQSCYLWAAIQIPNLLASIPIMRCIPFQCQPNVTAVNPRKVLPGFCLHQYVEHLNTKTQKPTPSGVAQTPRLLPSVLAFGCMFWNPIITNGVFWALASVPLLCAVLLGALCCSKVVPG